MELEDDGLGVHDVLVVGYFVEQATDDGRARSCLVRKMKRQIGITLFHM